MTTNDEHAAAASPGSDDEARSETAGQPGTVEDQRADAQPSDSASAEEATDEAEALGGEGGPS